MQSEWNNYSIGDISKINAESLKKGHTLSVIEYLDTSSVTENNFENTETLDANNAPSRAKRIVQDKDIIISTVRPNLKHYGFIVKPKDNLIVSTGFAVIRGNTQVVEPRYLYYFLSLDSTTKYLATIAEGSTSTYPSIKPSVISDMNIDLPSLLTQKKIAHILATLDEKIELNGKMNQTLEEMAQALFKSWFVDFDPVHAKAGCKSDTELGAVATELGISKEVLKLFPSEFVESEMGMIPLGWEVKTLGSYLTIKRGGSPRPIKDYIVKDGLPWVKIADATASDSPFLFKTKECIREEGLKKTVFLKKGSLILSNSATPGLPKFLDIDACIHDGWLHFPEKKLFGDEYLYLLFITLKKELILKGNGSVFTNLKTDILREQNVIIPSVNILRRFDQTVATIFSKIKSNGENINSLSKLRDALLSKLLSGELDVSELEIN